MDMCDLRGCDKPLKAYVGMVWGAAALCDEHLTEHLDRHPKAEVQYAEEDR